MGEAKQCDACGRLYPLSETLENKYSVHKDVGKDELEPTDLCGRCIIRVEALFGTTPATTGSRKSNWSPETRQAASERMRNYQARRKAERAAACPLHDTPWEECGCATKPGRDTDDDEISPKALRAMAEQVGDDDDEDAPLPTPVTPGLGLRSRKNAGGKCVVCKTKDCRYEYTRLEPDKSRATLVLCKKHARNAEAYDGYQTRIDRDNAYMTRVRAS